MKRGCSGTKARFASSVGWMMLLILLLTVPVQGMFQLANSTELKTGVDAWMRDHEGEGGLRRGDWRLGRVVGDKHESDVLRVR